MTYQGGRVRHEQVDPIKMKTTAVVMKEPERITLMPLEVTAPGKADVIVRSLWSGISTGTEKLLFEGRMPAFPGLNYPLVPGYETVGRVVEAGPDVPQDMLGALVFVPGAKGYRDAAALFGATASQLVTGADRVIPISDGMGETATLLSLAATAYHALHLPGAPVPGLIIGHGIVGRLAARILLALGHPAPDVIDINPARRGGADGYAVTAPGEIGQKRYAAVLDASGDPAILDAGVGLIERGGTVILAGFYSETLSFRFTPAFMREASFRIAAEFRPADVHAVLALMADGRLSLDGLITHSARPADAESAYRAAFGDAECLKMIIDWREAA